MVKRRRVRSIDRPDLEKEARWLLENVIADCADTTEVTLRDIQDVTSKKPRIESSIRAFRCKKEHLLILVEAGCLIDNEDGTYALRRPDWDPGNWADADIDDDLFGTEGVIPDGNRRTCTAQEPPCGGDWSLHTEVF